MSKSVKKSPRLDSQLPYITWFFIIIGIIQVLVLSIYGYIIYSLIKNAQAGNSGMEIIAIVINRVAIPAIVVVALINLVGLVVYFVRYKPKKMIRIGFALSLVLSVAVIGYVGYGVYANYSNEIEYQEQNKIIDIKNSEKQQRYIADNARPEITKETTIELLKSCQLKGIYIGDQTDREGGGWGELSLTGVVLTKIDGQPYRISVADRLIPEIVPIAREAQKTCPDLQFSIDGKYEMRQADGTWR